MQQQPSTGGVGQVADNASMPHSTTSSSWEDSLFDLEHSLLGTNDHDCFNFGEAFAADKEFIEGVTMNNLRWPGPLLLPPPGNAPSTMPPQEMQQTLKKADAQKQGCECLGALVKVLEHVGQSQTQSDSTGIDMHLMSLRQAMNICSEVVSCTNCSTCSDSPVLVATIVQLFVSISDQLGGLCGLPRDGETDDADVGQVDLGVIWVGRYRLEAPEMRLQLIREVSVMHLTDLRGLLRKLKERLGPCRGVGQQVVEGEQKAGAVCDSIRALIDKQHHRVK